MQDVADEIGTGPDAPEVLDTLLHWIDIDRKHTALKALQGMIWDAGYAGAEFRAHVYPEVPARLAAWKAAGLDLYVYSSGSVKAQKLFFGHSEAGDLSGLFDGHFDTTIGGKRDAASYAAILRRSAATAMRCCSCPMSSPKPDAAREAGLHTGLLERGGPVADRNGHPAWPDFDAIVPLSPAWREDVARLPAPAGDNAAPAFRHRRERRRRCTGAEGEPEGESPERAGRACQPRRFRRVCRPCAPDCWFT